jgi:hemerythrin
MAINEQRQAESPGVKPQRPLPTLFGRLTTAFSGHDHLRPMVERLRRMCAILQAQRAAPIDSELSPATLIPELFSGLAQHFHAEETEAYFGAVLADRPAFVLTIAELKAEHALMLETLRELCVLADDEAQWREIATPVLDLIQRLQAHERRETALLQEYFQQEQASNNR